MKSNTTSSFRTTEENKKALSEIHGSVSSGAEKAIDVYLALRGRSLKDLEGRFTKSELSYLVDILNGTMFEPRWAVNPDMLIASVQDADKYEGLAAKWEVDREKLEKKVSELSAAQCLFLQEEIQGFWYQNPGESKDMESFLDKYTTA